MRPGPYFAPEVYKDKEKLAQGILRAHRASKEAYKDQRETQWPRDYLHFMSKHDPKQYGLAVVEFNVPNMPFLPWPRQQVEVLKAGIAPAIRESEPLARLAPEAPTITSDKVETENDLQACTDDMQLYINNVLFNTVKVRRECGSWIQGCLIYGFQWLFAEWETLEDDDWESADLGGGRTEFRKRLVKKPRPGHAKVTAMSPYDVYPQPGCDGTDEDTAAYPAQYIQRVIVMSVDNLAAFIEGTENKKWAVKDGLKDGETLLKHLEKFMGKQKGRDEIEKGAQVQAERLTTGDPASASIEALRMVRIIDHWERKAHFWVIADSDSAGELILDEQGDDKPYKLAGIPFCRLRLMPVTGELLGQSVVWLISGLVHLANVWMAIRAVHLGKLSGPIILVNTNAGLSAADLLAHPGQPIDLRGAVPLAESLFMQEYPDTTSKLVGEIEYLSSQTQVTAGATDFAMGSAPKGFNDTVRGLGMMEEKLSARMGEMAVQFGEDLGDLVRLLIAIGAEYVNDETAFIITGRTGKAEIRSVAATALKRGWRVTVDTRPIATSKAMRLQGLVNIGQVAGQWEELNHGDFLMRLATAAEEPHPHSLVKGFVEDGGTAESENIFFLKTGRYPPVEFSDNDFEHVPVHDNPENILAAQKAGTEAARLAHIQEHLVKAGVITPQQPTSPVALPPTAMPGMGQPQGGFIPPQGPPGPEAVPMGQPVAPGPRPLEGQGALGPEEIAQGV